MSENQKDQRNQKTDSKSHQEQTQEGKKKTEINPNNPTASQSNQKGSQQGSHQGNQQRQGSTSNQGPMDSKDKQNAGLQKESVENTAYGKSKGDSAGNRKDVKAGNQNNGKGNR